ncbi:transcriptional regulator [Actinopolyspora erythraea]|uniref:Transcriptional regulator n=1 Tax=Actinopolyspora erythraea TaxID=414996 RepID=A0A099D918_9ACTN|nr:helix-turn-helix transcriptional regulator [Actinopolyspora erythraea]ASU79970.1 transcriptional regulator [Actinopolyspora erythraea]KGI82307.1 XRE family transcriptional regulator [Actinopolyspora erythraea]
MSDRGKLFGTELRRLRIAAGISLLGLAKRVHYSKGYLSKIETGLKKPLPELARVCDNELAAGGELARLVPVTPSEAPPPSQEEGEVWPMGLARDGTGPVQAVSRRGLLAAGAASAVSFRTGTGGGPAVEESSLRTFRTMFGQFRELGQTANHEVVLPALLAHTQTLRELAGHASAGNREDILVLGARYAEYAGWMAQEAGEERTALWWTERAAEMADSAGDRDLAEYTRVRRALFALYRGDARGTIELARRARHGRLPPRIRALSLQREAQGHALAGDHYSCMRSLDSAREAHSAASADSELALGSTNLVDPVAMVTGWCLHDLGRPGEASSVLDREIQRVPTRASRSRARYGVRRALAHAAAGNVEHACALASRMLDTVDAIGSATVTTDLRRLDRTLARFRGNSSVRELIPRLTQSLRVRTDW